MKLIRLREPIFLFKILAYMIFLYNASLILKQNFILIL